MTVTPYDFYRMTGLSFEGAIISLDSMSGMQLGIDLLGRKYSIMTISYFELVSDYMFLSQRTTEECVRMAKAFLLHLMEAYLFANGGVFEVANPLLGFWGGTEGQLGASMSYLSLLHPRHS